MSINLLGCIGVGKSSLCHALARAIEKDTGKPCRELLEPAAIEDGVKSVFLERFYKDEPRWAFTVQVEMLCFRRKQIRLAQNLAFNGECSVADNSYFGDSCFVTLLEKEGKLSHDEADLYFELFHQMSEDVMYPQAFVYLDVNPATALERINKRMSEKAGRSMESGIATSYLEGLIGEYNELVGNLSRFSHVVRLDWNPPRTRERLDEEAGDLWSYIKKLRDTSPIPCQIGL